MARNDQGAGPKVGQVVLYNNAGAIVPGIINQVNNTGTVNLCSFSPGGAGTDRATVAYSPGAQTTGTWGYLEFF
jgi:hypothetical protein